MTDEIDMPGEPARRKPGPKPKAPPAAAAQVAPDAGDDDLAAFDEDDLPPSPGAAMPARHAKGFTPEQQALIASMIADAVRASKAGQDPGTAAKHAVGIPDKLPSQEEARVMSEAMIAKGIRPRGILTPDGWYIHPEAARVRDYGIARLALPE